jgi:hypothetical protein
VAAWRRWRWSRAGVRIVLVMSGLALSFVPRLPEMRLNPEIVFYFSCRRCKIATAFFFFPPLTPAVSERE